VPELRPGDIVIMDNLSSHKGLAVRQKTLERIARDMLTEIAFQGVVRLPGP
jgi:hypothetical protein